MDNLACLKIKNELESFLSSYSGDTSENDIVDNFCYNCGNELKVCELRKTNSATNKCPLVLSNVNDGMSFIFYYV